MEAIQTCKRIHKGSARKRQLQYIGKLLRDETLLTEAKALIDRMDAGSKAHLQTFHRLEQWRERLIGEDDRVMDEIIEAYPGTDRQHLRQLTRKAIDERYREASPPIHYRKLFQYLKQLAENDSY
ncbi:MAG: ribosome biogenesis factor YjgA [Gammaproteobacteria bacterium]|nr:ribosome biogenesis factor YjgA [Gammaproteobacteria bacterium]